MHTMHMAQDVADVRVGFCFGDPHALVRGVACMWNVHSRS